MNAQIQYASPSGLTSTPSLSAREVPFVSAPVRCGRRRHDEVGHLEITNLRLRIRAAIDVNIAWGDVAGIEHADRDMVVSIRDRRRKYRFCFHTGEEANQVTLLARSLLAL